MKKSNRLKTYIICSSAIISMAFVHAFFVSIVKININPESRKAEIAIKLDTEDLINSLESLSNKKIFLGEEKEIPGAEIILHEYVHNRFQLMINDTLLPSTVLGYEQEIDFIWVYIESDTIPNSAKKLSIDCTILTVELPKQTNIIKFKNGDSTSSEILDNINTKVAFNL